MMDTPSLLIDGDIYRRNISRMQELANRNGVALRPHVKTHKCPELAREQIEAGASGIAVAKLSEAELMINHGFRDIQIASEISSETKINRMLALTDRASISCAVDSHDNVRDIGQIFHAAGKEVGLLIELNNGFDRCGLSYNSEILSLAREIHDSAGVHFEGVMIHAGQAYAAADQQMIEKIGIAEGEFAFKAASVIRDAGIDCRTVSVGSTPTAKFAATVKGVTELRVGNYIFNDMIQVSLGTVGIDDCALSVRGSVMSTSSGQRIIIDCGSKALTTDRGVHGSSTTSGYGYIPDYDLWITRLSEEHGIIETTVRSAKPGDQVRVIPCHACAVMNLFDSVFVGESNGSLRELSVAARGLST